MNLIALRDFRNPDKQQIKVKDALHPDHIHKGSRFELDERAKNNDRLILELNAAGCIGDANNEQTCKAIDAEVANEKKKAVEAEAKTAKK